MQTCWRMEACDAASDARAGWLIARDGTDLPTPLFQPVATAGSLRTLDWDDLWALGYRHVLMNTYHLAVRPGVEEIERSGGVKAFTAWPGSVLTDSGGFQAFSLASRRTLRPDGIRFTDHAGGARHHFTPRSVLSAQLAFGVDFAMCLDVCTGLPAPRNRVARDMALTHAWAVEQAALWPELLSMAGAPEAGRRHFSAAGDSAAGTPPLPVSGADSVPPLPPRLFGIAQGGLEEDLRRESIALIASLSFDGVALGGLAVGEPREDFHHMAALCGPLLPSERVRYLLGVGEPADLLFAVAHGFDLFDCVQPTRLARHGTAYTSAGKLHLRHAIFSGDARPLDAGCRCRVCRTYSRAYLRHLFVLHEHSFARLLTLHNLAFYRALLSRARRRIIAGTYGKWWEKQYALVDRVVPEGL